MCVLPHRAGLPFFTARGIYFHQHSSDAAHDETVRARLVPHIRGGRARRDPNIYRTMASDETWRVVVVSQERGTKKNVSHSVGGFPDHEAALKAVKTFEEQANRATTNLAVLESPNGERLAIMPVDFRSTKIEKEEWMGLA
jgi:hypothetical protein